MRFLLVFVPFFLLFALHGRRIGVLDDAVAFYKSKAWTDLAPQRDKSQKTIRGT
jgi:hypothetical protein